MVMQLKVYSPTEILLDLPVNQVDFESIDGFYTLLPKHVDVVSALKQSILSYKSSDKKGYIACNQGVLVKKGDTVFVSTKLGIKGNDLKELQRIIEIDFKEMEEKRKEVNLTMARLEIGLTKGLVSLNKNHGGNDAGI